MCGAASRRAPHLALPVVLSPRSRRQCRQLYETMYTEHCQPGKPWFLEFLLELGHIDLTNCPHGWHVSSPSAGRADTTWHNTPALNHILRLSGPKSPVRQTLQGLRDHLPGAKGKGQTSLGQVKFFMSHLSYLEGSEGPATAPHQRELEWDKITGHLTCTFFSQTSS